MLFAKGLDATRVGALRRLCHGWILPSVSLRTDYVGDDDGPIEIAVKISEYFCLEEGAYNGFEPGVELGIQFYG